MTELQKLSAQDLQTMIENDPDHLLVLDTRSPPEFTQNHIPKSLFIPLVPPFEKWVKFFIETDKKIALVTPEDKLQDAQTRLASAGYTNLAGYLEGGFQSWVTAGFSTDSIDTITYNTAEEFEQQVKNKLVLDVRQPNECKQSQCYPDGKW